MVAANMGSDPALDGGGGWGGAEELAALQARLKYLQELEATKQRIQELLGAHLRLQHHSTGLTSADLQTENRTASQAFELLIRSTPNRPN